VGAAPTGSGKTFAFLLPIAQYLLEQQQQQEEQPDETQSQRQPLQALIITPTRELAMQIHAESEQLITAALRLQSNGSRIPTRVGLVVGGLAHVKQQRVLKKYQPAVIVATPGRLWELVSPVYTSEQCICLLFRVEEDISFAVT
jgi:ATP-dependent RNA helicase DDX24/MAK5